MKTEINDATAAFSLTSDEQRWAAVLSRDISADGQFYYSVATPMCIAVRPVHRVWHGARTSHFMRVVLMQKQLDFVPVNAANRTSPRSVNNM